MKALNIGLGDRIKIVTSLNTYYGIICRVGCETVKVHGESQSWPLMTLIIMRKTQEFRAGEKDLPNRWDVSILVDNMRHFTNEEIRNILGYGYSSGKKYYVLRNKKYVEIKPEDLK